MKNIKKYVIAVMVMCSCVFASLLFIGCGSPAAPPAPPVETPVPITFKFVEPTDLQIDLSTVSLATSASILKTVDPGGEFSEEITFGPQYVQNGFQNIFIPLLNGISTIEIPVSETQTTYQASVDFGSAPEADWIMLQGVRDVKISFADFDFDNDGALEGCSGHTAGLPVCARMWLDDERYVAWVFESYPYFDDPTTAEDDATPGIGRYKLIAFRSEDYFPDHGFLRMDYDFEDTENALLDVFSRSFWMDDDGSGVGVRIHLAQTGPASTALKQIGFILTTDLDGYANPDVLWEEELDYIAQYRESFDFWSGSIDDQVNKFGLDDIINQCAVISTGNGTDEANCADVGGVDIRVGGLPFLDPLDLNDVAMPDDFPEAPPAGMF